MKKPFGQKSCVAIVLMYVLLAFMLCGCSDDDDSEESSSGGKKLEVTFNDTKLNVFQGYHKVIKQVVKNGTDVVDARRMEYLDENGDLLLGDNGKPIRIKQSSEHWKALYVSYFSKEQVIDKDQNSGIYEAASYQILPPPEDGEGGLQNLIINGKVSSEITVDDLKKSCLDVTKVQFTSADTYVELYINGRRISPDDSYYDDSADEQKVRDILKLRRDLPSRLSGFLPAYLNMKIAVDYDENIEEWLNTRDMKNTLFLVQKIEEAYRNREESICVVYYSMRNGECSDVTIRVATR